MFIRRELVIFIIIFVLTTKIKTSKGRIYEGKHKNHRELNKLHFYGLQTRHHNHFLHKKHHKCSLERSYYRQAHVKKSSRYPTLDKIVHRLDNQIDYLDKIKMATTNPFDEWNVTSPPPTTFSDKSDIYAYVTVGLKKGTPTKDGHAARDELEHLATKEDFDVKFGRGDDPDVSTENGASNKDFMQDHTTSSPWENEQHDINSHVEGSSKNPSEGPSTVSTLPSQMPKNDEDQKKDLILDKVPSWSVGQLAARFPDWENRNKKKTPTPYVAAHAHYDQVLRMGDCHIPKEKVIRVHEVHPDPSKSYSPSCTILHQCGDDTGCCRDLKQVCKPKNTTKVELYFFKVQKLPSSYGFPGALNETKGALCYEVVAEVCRRNLNSYPEGVPFRNPGKCECQKRTEEPLPRDSEFQRNHPKKHGTSGEAKRKKSNCTCPSRYSARFLSDDSCVCDCFDKQDDCLVLKKGKSHFSYHDKLCIQSGSCLMPSCEFGSYIRQFGRCPNKSEKYHYRWSRILSYRDLIT